jgi:glycosyltransferase involved in cell wall biosynthesis
MTLDASLATKRPARDDSLGETPRDVGTIRAVTFSTLFPNGVRPNHGIFVENRLRKLVADGRVQARVIAPVPWFPFSFVRFRNYGDFARIPKIETRHGLEVAHPRYPTIPEFGMTVAPWLLYRWSLDAMNRLITSGGDFDLIDAHYFYPDGVAAALLGQRLNKPVVITARGTDVNLIASFDRPRRMILWAAMQAAAVITVSDALRNRLIELGAPAEKIVTLRNGVDLDTFRPVDREEARRALGVRGPVIVTVGNVIETKGQRLVVRALADIPDAQLMIVGDGADVPVLKALAADLGVSDRLKFLGRIPHDRLREVFGAADVSVLASVREGWPNVLLESMACGTPAVATRVGGVPEIIARPESGAIVDERNPKAIARVINEVLARLPEREATRAYAELFSWDATTEGQIEMFRAALGRLNP